MFFISGHFKLHNSIFDVTAAFLEATNDYRQFCFLPPGLLGPNANYRREVLKALYGEKQAPKLWYDLLNSILVDKMGYERCPDCYCLYKKFVPLTGKFMYICVHVDDGFMAFNHLGMDDEFIAELNKHVKKATLVKEVKKFLGMELEKIENHVRVHHSNYIQSIDLLGISSDSKKATIPMSPSVNLKVTKPNPENENLLPVTGKLRYPADRGRFDILTSVGKISSDGLPHPSNEHVDAAK